MNVIYILGTGSRWDNNELRYSLRSLEQYGLNVDKVYIAGELPKWLQNVEHIACRDISDKKADNAWYKISVICRVTKEPFILMNDDFFFTKTVDVNDIPMYQDGTIENLIGRYSVTSNYTRAQHRTIDVLKKHCQSFDNYALHVPMPVYPEAMTKYFYTMSSPGISFRNFYGNVCEYPARKEQLSDLKFARPVSKEEFQRRISDRSFFSIGDKFLTVDGKQSLIGMYPDPSKYERVNKIFKP